MQETEQVETEAIKRKQDAAFMLQNKLPEYKQQNRSLATAPDKREVRPETSSNGASARSDESKAFDGGEAFKGSGGEAGIVDPKTELDGITDSGATDEKGYSIVGHDSQSQRSPGSAFKKRKLNKVTLKK